MDQTRSPSLRSLSRRARRARRAQRGMTLIEIMIVVVIMAMIASAVSIGVFSQAKKAKVSAAEEGVRTVEHAAQLWQQDHHGCPTVQQLVSDRVLDAHASTRDPWGNEYTLTCDGDEVTVRSKGPDGRDGTDDDIPQQHASGESSGGGH